MSTIPSMNLFSTQLVANVGKASKQPKTHMPIKQVNTLKSNDKIKMNIMNLGSKKPCGRCGGAK